VRRSNAGPYALASAAIYSNSFAHRLFIMAETFWVYLWAFDSFFSCLVIRLVRTAFFMILLAGLEVPIYHFAGVKLNSEGGKVFLGDFRRDRSKALR